MAFRLSGKAVTDIINLYVLGVERFGRVQAEHYSEQLHQAFDHLAAFPRAARERLELTPPVRVQPYQSHLIIYLIQGEHILILRVRHAREDWEKDL